MIHFTPMATATRRLTMLADAHGPLDDLPVTQLAIPTATKRLLIEIHSVVPDRRAETYPAGSIFNGCFQHLLAGEIKRRRRDSNPRYGYPYNGFQDRRLKPLGHSSKSFVKTTFVHTVDLHLYRRQT